MVLGMIGAVHCTTPLPIPPAPQGTQVEFDPFGTPPRLPTPTDLIRDAQTGLLQIPPTDGASPAQQDFDAYLRTLNGYPASVVAEMRLTHRIDEKTLHRETIRVFDLTDGGATEVNGLLYEAQEITENEKTLTLIRIKHPQGWSRGHTYAVYVMNGLKDVDGKAIQRSSYFDLAASSDPLCAWDTTLSYNKQSGLCEVPAGDSSASGCCVRTVSAGLFNLARRQIQEKLSGSRPNAATLEAEERKQMRYLGSTLEKLRQGYNQLLGVATLKGFSRDDVVMVWHFSIVSMTEITLDPVSGVIPFPNNLLRDSKTGKVAIPARAGETDTQKALREGLNTLDGFPTLGLYYAPYQGTIDPKSVKLGDSVLVFNVSTGQLESNWSLEIQESAAAFVAKPTQPLQEKTTYALVLLSKFKGNSLQPQSGLTDTQGRRLVAAPFLALLRSKYPLIQGTKSTIRTVDDNTAALAEDARLAHQPLFDALEKKQINRSDIVAAWTFTTQSITEVMTQLRALPWSLLGTKDQNQPRWSGIFDPSLTGFPAGIPKSDLGGWVPQGTFVSWLALDEQGRGTLLTDPTRGKEVTLPFLMTVPKGSAPPSGWPLVVFQHGLTRAKSDMLALANTLASTGIATIAFDVIYHGTRSRCMLDTHCDDNGSAGACDAKSGACRKGKLADRNQDNIPDASGAYFLNTTNPFAIRDNFRQHVIDAAALLRGVALQAAQGLKDPQGNDINFKIDPNKVSLVGHSLGAILGVLVLATDPLPSRGVLATPGSPLVDIILTAPNFQDVKKDLLQSFQVKEGSQAYLQLVATLQWILDPAESGNFASFATQGGLPDLTQPDKKKLSAKSVITLLAGQDQTIPVALGQNLARWMKISNESIQKTTYSAQGHAFLLRPDPDGSLNATVTAQIQVATFLATGQLCSPQIEQQVCR